MEDIRKKITDIILARQEENDDDFIRLDITINGEEYGQIFNAWDWDGETYVIVDGACVDIDDIREDVLETIYKKIL